MYLLIVIYADILKHSLKRQNVWMFLYDMYFIHSTAWLFLFNLFWKSFHFAAAATAKLLQSCPTVQPHRRQPTRLLCPWASPGKNSGVGCHFLLQCMKVKSESEVAQLCPTLSDPMDRSPPGSSVHGIFQARVLEWGAIAFSDLSTLEHVISYLPHRILLHTYTKI